MYEGEHIVLAKQGNDNSWFGGGIKVGDAKILSSYM